MRRFSPILLAGFFLSLPLAAQSITPTRLHSEGRENPLGVDTATPQLGWQLTANEPSSRGLLQTAYHVLVASTPAILARDQGDLWDSGKITSDADAQISYAGQSLVSSQRVFWKVRVWDQSGKRSDWSHVAQWTQGILTPADWHAGWITAPVESKIVSPLFRREFSVKPGLARATVHAWVAAQTTDGPGGVLTGLSVAAAPIKAIETLRPVATRELSPGVLVYDLGQNASLMPRLAVTGPAGSSVRLIPSELVRANGDIEDTMCNGNNWWHYTLKGAPSETWFPQFYYRGARYLKVILTAAPGDTALPKLVSLEGVVVHTASAPAGNFTTSNELFNRIYTLIRWAQRSNLVSIITDCPTREKLGWLEQYHLNGPALRYNYDLAALFTKGLRDMQDSQQGNGMIPTTAPEYPRFGGNFRDSPEWGGAFILSAWQHYEFHADTDLLRRTYADQQRYASYLSGRARDHIIDYGLGDWYDLGPKPPGESQLTPRALTGTATYYEEIRAMSLIAAVLGHADDAARFSAQAVEIRDAFNKKFFNADTKNYATGSQCSNAMPLVLDLVPAEHRAAVLENLVKDVQAKGPTAGDVGFRYLLRALADNGRSDVIFTMNNQSDKPGYGMQLAKGATALTEAWDGLRRSSQNHFMLGHLNEWFHHDLAGIRSDPAGPGFKKIIIKPAIVGDFTQVSASHEAGSGRIVSSWKRTGGRLTLDVIIPPNTTATVYVPTDVVSRMLEGWLPAGRAPGVKYLRNEDNAAVFEIGSGSYHFTSDFSSR